MKRVVALCVLAGVFAFTGVARAEMKFGFVDLSKIFSEYSKTKDYDKVLGDKQTAYEADREKMVTDVKQFQDKINLLSEKEKDAKKSELETKIKNLQEYDRQKQTDLRKEQDEKMKELLKDIDDAIQQYSSKENFTFVFNNRVLVYEDKTLDITDKIIAIVNKGKSK
jgi:Skp family chaperone for outer membrane proteins